MHMLSTAVCGQVGITKMMPWHLESLWTFSLTGMSTLSPNEEHVEN